MSKCLVFLPASLYSINEDGFLYGVFKEYHQDNDLNVLSCFYVLGIESTSSDKFEKYGDRSCAIGSFSCESEELSFQSEHFQSLAGIHVIRIEGGFKVRFSRDFEKKYSLNGNKAVLLVYDEKVFQRSELLVKESECNIPCQDHFKVLARFLHAQKFGQGSTLLFVLRRVLWLLLSVASVFLRALSKLKPLLEYSALGSHLHRFLESVVWSLRCLHQQQWVSLKLGNYILTTALDICGGILVLQGVEYFGPGHPLSADLLNVAKNVVNLLQHVLKWLSGSPAGLKLNGPFSLVMGRFFLYHINLWWVFLSVTQPLLEFTFQVFLGLGRLGLTFQAAILEDLLSLVSFHIYCIYVYAARLFYLQLSGLLALWRLFLGRKWNPLRERVDSCQYSPDQLFVGTLAFTILLFLLPTTLMYYVVFTTMRVVLLIMASVMKHASYLLRVLPLYSSIHWLLGSNVVCSSVRVTPKSENSCGQLVLFVSPIADSWWHTVKNCVPDTVKCPPSIPFGLLLHKLAFGELVYPV